MKLTEIIRRNRELGAALSGEKYTVAIISNITVNQLKEVLELTLREQGINAAVEIGDYDSVVQDSERFSNANAVVVFWEPGNLIDGLIDKIYTISQSQLLLLQERVKSEIDLVLKNLASTSLVLINEFSSLLFETNVLKNGPLKNLCNSLNTTLQGQTAGNAILVDTGYVIAKTGIKAAKDLRMFHSSKALYTLDFFKNYADTISPAIKAATGRIKKVIALDCDNTLWGGILGEDGEENIQMNDNTLNGKAYKEVQTILRSLQSEGVLLALCSKNNLAEVDKILSHHPDMILKEEHIIAKRINWQDKASNLRELSASLNLGLDSFIFIDDSSFEIGLIQKELPQVLCVQVPANLSEYSSAIRELRKDFFSLSTTADDHLKTEQYQVEQQRKSHSAQFNSTEEYLASLELGVSIQWKDKMPVPRASQMTQKTNQFNLTTRRYTEIDISKMQADNDFTIAVLSVTDRYGDYGVSGMAIIKADHKNASATMDSFLMSCRVIGRNVEYAFFDIIVEKLLKDGVKTLRAEYVPTAKNKQVEKFYESIGMRILLETELNKEYAMTLEEYKPKKIAYITVL